MTAEANNARGEWVLVPRMPTVAMMDAWRDAPEMWVEAYAAMLAAAPPPAAAEPKTLPVPTRVHLIGETAVIVGTPGRGWDEDAQDAHNCDAMGCATIGPHVLARVPFTDERALSQQPEARGVVDEAMVERATTAYLQSRGTYEGEVPVDRDDIRAALTAALAQQPAAGAAMEFDGTDREVLREFIRICREHKPVGPWPGERVCKAIERAMDNEKPFRFIAEADMAPERAPSMKDADRMLSGPRRASGHLDRKRFERAPCYLCGYNGPGYYQPDTHPCAAKYHATKHQEPTDDC